MKRLIVFGLLILLSNCASSQTYKTDMFELTLPTGWSVETRVKDEICHFYGFTASSNSHYERNPLICITITPHIVDNKTRLDSDAQEFMRNKIITQRGDNYSLSMISNIQALSIPIVCKGVDFIKSGQLATFNLNNCSYSIVYLAEEKDIPILEVIIKSLKIYTQVQSPVDESQLVKYILFTAKKTLPKVIEPPFILNDIYLDGKEIVYKFTIDVPFSAITEEVIQMFKEVKQESILKLQQSDDAITRLATSGHYSFRHDYFSNEGQYICGYTISKIDL